MRFLMNICETTAKTRFVVLKDLDIDLKWGKSEGIESHSQLAVWFPLKSARTRQLNIFEDLSSNSYLTAKNWTANSTWFELWIELHKIVEYSALKGTTKISHFSPCFRPKFKAYVWEHCSNVSSTLPNHMLWPLTWAARSMSTTLWGRTFL